ncbi:hypothetical protein [Archangium violaceum]
MRAWPRREGHRRLKRSSFHPGALAEGVIAWIREAESKDVAYNIQVTGG